LIIAIAEYNQVEETPFMRDTLVSEHLVGELHDAAKACRDELSDALHHVFLELDRRSLTAKIEKLDALLSASSEALQGPWWTMPRPIVGLW
jgi:hypothetical protein